MSHGTVDYYSPHDDLVDCVTELQNAVLGLDTVAGKLDTSITELTYIQADTASRRHALFATITTSCKEIIQYLLVGWRYSATFVAHPDNDADIYLYGTDDCSGNVVATLSPGDVLTRVPDNNDVSAKAASGTQYLAVFMGGVGK